MTKKIKASLAKALLQGGKMSHALYEYELEEHIDYWYKGLKADRDDFVFVVMENSGHVAMLVIMPDKTIYINEQARAKLAEFWKINYMANMKRLIPGMAQQLASNIIYVTGVKMTTDTHPRRVVGRRSHNLKGF
jgi:hypothetical protein